MSKLYIPQGHNIPIQLEQMISNEDIQNHRIVKDEKRINRVGAKKVNAILHAHNWGNNTGKGVIDR